MAGEQYDPFVNRDTPIPVISINDGRGDAPSPARSSRREALKQSVPATKLREKLESIGQRPDSPTIGSLQDRLVTMLLQQVIPSEEGGPTEAKDRRSTKYVERPGFSLPVMSNNFRRFNARIGVAFVFQSRMIRLFTWKKSTHTLSFLAIYTFICLDPTLLAALPLALCLFFIMIPAFLARHPPPPSNHPMDLYPLQGPPLAPAQNIKPASEFSKDFFHNMRDLQNCMEDFSRGHDAAITLLAPPTNFSNEALSSTIFVLLSALTCLLFIASHLLPWRAIFLVAGWAAICSNHPAVQELVHTTHADQKIEEGEVQARSWLLRFASTDIVLSGAPEKREVEIFELQRRSMATLDAEYEPFLFGPSPYAPLSPARIAGDRPKGTRFFEDVEPPRGWRWSDKKWTLDLLSREWVEERCVTGVEVEIEGERWVTDIMYDEEVHHEDDVKPGPITDKAKEKGKEKATAGVAWEEGNETGKKGEWRRRRWVRLVERKFMEATTDT